MARHVYVRELPAGFRETEVAPFPIGETPSLAGRPQIEEAERILRTVAPFEFRESARAPAVARVTRLESFVDALRDVPIDTLEFALYGGGMERWVREAVGDVVLEREIAGIRALARHGEPLRTVLYTTARSRFDELTNL